MKEKKIYQTYEQSKCQVDYHDSCSTQWADCKGYGATAFCPKFCNVKDCQAALALHGKLTRYQPKYVPEAKCADLPKFNCPKLAERGDCYASPQQFGQLCAKTCGLCSNMKKYMPFSFEDQRLSRWLADFNSGQYKKYAKVLIRRRKMIKRKIINRKC
uniref:ShKT domain-containing protein n=1 Tax=Romanomermis culicivorax TaxID=13658 RepID=A0A915KF05_ROMCU